MGHHSAIWDEYSRFHGIIAWLSFLMIIYRNIGFKLSFHPLVFTPPILLHQSQFHPHLRSQSNQIHFPDHLHHPIDHIKKSNNPVMPDTKAISAGVGDSVGSMNPPDTEPRHISLNDGESAHDATEGSPESPDQPNPDSLNGFDNLLNLNTIATYDSLEFYNNLDSLEYSLQPTHTISCKCFKNGHKMSAFLLLLNLSALFLALMSLATIIVCGTLSNLYVYFDDNPGYKEQFPSDFSQYKTSIIYFLITYGVNIITTILLFLSSGIALSKTIDQQLLIPPLCSVIGIFRIVGFSLAFCGILNQFVVIVITLIVSRFLPKHYDVILYSTSVFYILSIFALIVLDLVIKNTIDYTFEVNEQLLLNQQIIDNASEQAIGPDDEPKGPYKISNLMHSQQIGLCPLDVALFSSIQLYNPAGWQVLKEFYYEQADVVRMNQYGNNYVNLDKFESKYQIMLNKQLLAKATKLGLSPSQIAMYTRVSVFIPPISGSSSLATPSGTIMIGGEELSYEEQICPICLCEFSGGYLSTYQNMGHHLQHSALPALPQQPPPRLSIDSTNTTNNISSDGHSVLRKGVDFSSHPPTPQSRLREISTISRVQHRNPSPNHSISRQVSQSHEHDGDQNYPTLHVIPRELPPPSPSHPFAHLANNIFSRIVDTQGPPATPPSKNSRIFNFTNNTDIPVTTPLATHQESPSATLNSIEMAPTQTALTSPSLVPHNSNNTPHNITPYSAASTHNKINNILAHDPAALQGMHRNPLIKEIRKHQHSTKIFTSPRDSQPPSKTPSKINSLAFDNTTNNSSMVNNNTSFHDPLQSTKTQKNTALAVQEDITETTHELTPNVIQTTPEVFEMDLLQHIPLSLVLSNNHCAYKQNHGLLNNIQFLSPQSLAAVHNDLHFIEKNIASLSSGGIEPPSVECPDILRTLPCLHTFHNQCITSWLLVQPFCPLCKKHVVTLNTIVEFATNCFVSFDIDSVVHDVQSDEGEQLLEYKKQNNPKNTIQNDGNEVTSSSFDDPIRAAKRRLLNIPSPLTQLPYRYVIKCLIDSENAKTPQSRSQSRASPSKDRLDTPSLNNTIKSTGKSPSISTKSCDFKLLKEFAQMLLKSNYNPLVPTSNGLLLPWIRSKRAISDSQMFHKLEPTTPENGVLEDSQSSRNDITDAFSFEPLNGTFVCDIVGSEYNAARVLEQNPYASLFGVNVSERHMAYAIMGTSELNDVPVGENIPVKVMLKHSTIIDMIYQNKSFLYYFLRTILLQNQQQNSTELQKIDNRNQDSYQLAFLLYQRLYPLSYIFNTSTYNPVILPPPHFLSPLGTQHLPKSNNVHALFSPMQSNMTVIPQHHITLENHQLKSIDEKSSFLLVENGSVTPPQMTNNDNKKEINSSQHEPPQTTLSYSSNYNAFSPESRHKKIEKIWATSLTSFNNDIDTLNVQDHIASNQSIASHSVIEELDGMKDYIE